MDSRPSDLVLDTQIQVEFSADLTHRFTVESQLSSERNVRRRQRKDTWQFEKLLGSGSFGTVSLHKCLTSESQAELQAVKMIDKNVVSKGIDYYKELEAIAKFSQRKYEGLFVEFLGWYENNDFVFIVMEYMEHGDLDSHLKKPLPESEAREITLQLTEGLQSLHENGFAHRDLKPANIFVFRRSPDWWVKLGDFGISKRFNENEGLQTWIGTPIFSAPEIQMLYPRGTNGHNVISHYTEKVDIWALGVTTYYMVFHDYPFKPRKPVTLSHYVQGAALPLPKSSLSPVSKECYRFIKAILEPNATKRPSAKEALENEWLKGPEIPVANLDRLSLNETTSISVALGREVQAAPESIHATPEKTKIISHSSGRSNSEGSMRADTPSAIHINFAANEDSAEQAYIFNQGQLPVVSPNVAYPKRALEEIDSDSRLHRLQDIHRLGVQLFHQKKYAEAEIMLQKAAKERNQELGLAEHDTRNSFHCLGVLYYHMSKYRESKRLFQQVLEVQQREFGQIHQSTLLTEYWIGLTMLRDGMAKKGRLTLKRVANIQRYILGPNHPDTLLSLSKLDQRQSPQWLEPSNSASLPQISPDTQPSELDRITNSMRESIQYLKAELWPENHNLKSVYSNPRVIVRLPPNAWQPIAKSHSEESLSRKIETYYRTMADLGQWLHGKGHYKAAQNNLAMAVDGLKECLGPTTRGEYLDALYWLGWTQLKLNQYKKAEHTFRAACGWESSHALGLALSKQGKFAIAESILRRLVEKETIISEVPRFQLGLVLCKQGKFDEAKEHPRKAFVSLEFRQTLPLTTEYWIQRIRHYWKDYELPLTCRVKLPGQIPRSVKRNRYTNVWPRTAAT
ncbi:hypothetical protein N7522_003410 [Penicillium canescens]|nr:hypothetical protein N7522_003410 [Penicillium canescens]